MFGLRGRGSGDDRLELVEDYICQCLVFKKIACITMVQKVLNPCFAFFFRMETFQEAGVQMLKEFRALLQHSPLPLPGTRLLQLLALNMFAIETTQLKGGELTEKFIPFSSESLKNAEQETSEDRSIKACELDFSSR
ncbi:Telomerase-binding protein EST1A [Vespula maculifrons]|uniref:Telomerase-binding protein EST1A n=1 Tax=Vespula maculifrons TaxID=7453 RepID=A0ABD2C7T4_VESMC